VTQLEQPDLPVDVPALHRLRRGEDDHRGGVGESRNRLAGQAGLRENLASIAKDRSHARRPPHGPAIDTKPFEATGYPLRHAGIGGVVGKKRAIFEIHGQRLTPGGNQQ
jgi:hypothetical protein